MSAPNTYPNFVADQVLKANHLNELFDYLDQENRHTRRCLIGMGIVCGLEISFEDNSIGITKGCGVSSEGYLFDFEGGGFTHCRDYALPADFDPNDDSDNDYKPLYAGLKMIQLLTTQEKASDKTLGSAIGKLSDYAVMLFLERTNTDLKNCTTNDCDDKGKKISFTIIPVIVEISSLTKVFTDVSTLAPKTKLPDLKLRRYNIPVKKMKSPTQLLNEFLNICDDTTIAAIANAYKNSYQLYQGILPVQEGTPFDQLEGKLIEQREIIKNSSPVFAQYFYDYLDDLIKAYHEFKAKANEILSVCCPNENLFPLHLLLGEAGKKSMNNKLAFREYFTYSPLFDKAGAIQNEAVMLFDRMKQMEANFALPSLKETRKIEIKITPSLLGREVLSERAIPFYYEIDPLYKLWNYRKTIGNNAETNLAYYANTYTLDDGIVNPLRYELEPYNFFRIEGHIGKNHTEALVNIAGQKQSNNLPFDIISLNLSPSFNGKNTNNVNCYFGDLESMYNVMLAEMLCKYHSMICPLVNTKLVLRGMKKASSVPADGKVDEKAEAEKILLAEEKKLLLEKSNSRSRLVNASSNYSKMMLFIEAMKKQKKYVKGTFIKTFCIPTTGSYGAYYLQMLKGKNNSLSMFKDAAQGGKLTAMQLYFSLFDAIEELIGACVTNTLGNMDIEEFSDKYKKLLQVVRSLFNLSSATLEDDALDQSDFMKLEILSELQYLCLDSRIRELYFEYQKRVKTISLEKIFSGYAALHSGIEHKAGVPVGGTFILVYNDDERNANNIKAELEEANRLKYEKAFYDDNETKIEVKKSNIPVKSSTEKSSERDMIEEVKKLLEQKRKHYSEEQLDYMNTLLHKLGIASKGSNEILGVPNKMVFADFYLPYMCCSDCAPISYIIENNPIPKEDSSISLKAKFTTFCKSDIPILPLSAAPEGGSFTVNGKAVSPINKGNNNYELSTDSFVEGSNNLEYVLPNALKANLEITILPIPDALFTFVINENVPNEVSFTSLSKDSTLSHAWEFIDPKGNKKTSSEAHPIMSFEFTTEAVSIAVTHLVKTKDGCMSSDNQTVNLEIKKTAINTTKTFCYTDPIVFEPAGIAIEIVDETEMETIFNKNKMVLDTATSKIVFNDKQPTQNINFTLIYKIKSSTEIITKTVSTTIEFSDAGFTTAESASQKNRVSFTSLSNDPTLKHFWFFGNGNTNNNGIDSTEPNPVHDFVFTGNSAEFNVTHTIITQLGCKTFFEKKITLSATPKDITETKVFCKNEAILFEPAGSKIEMVDDSEMKLVFEQNGLSINKDNSKLVAKGTTPLQDISFTIRYKVTNGSTKLNKIVTILILFADATFTVKFTGRTQKQTLDFTAPNLAAGETPSWRILLDDDTTNEITSNELQLSIDTIKNKFKSLRVILLIIENKKTKCQTINNVLISSPNLAFIKTSNKAVTFPMK